MKYENDSDPPDDWDQDEKSVMIKVSLPEPDSENLFVEVAENTCSIEFEGKNIWKARLFADVDPTTKRITIKQNDVFIHVDKKTKGMEWASLQFRHGSKMASGEHDQMEDKQESGCLKQCNINHIKNDIYEKDIQTLNFILYITKADGINVNIEPEKLTVSFKTNDKDFLRMHQNTDSQTVFIWSSDLKDRVITENCKYSVKTKFVEIILYKEQLCKWGTLGKPQTKQAGSTAGAGDWRPIKTARTPESSGSVDQEASPTRVAKKNNHGAKGGAKSVNQKPTCTVSPLAQQRQGPSKENAIHPLQPNGFTGLDNLGNTCFMNGVLQVLANTRELKDFMLEDNVTQEINHDNPLGTGGQLVTSFAVLMKILWSRKYKSYAPSKFKTIIASKASQFMGFAQHDAQEFMGFLIDGLHEDLNRVKKKPYFEADEGSDTKPDEVIAEESWKRHMARNDSFISDIFQGQYKSKLVCPVCNKVSITFDPFTTLSVPLPRKKQQLAVYFWSKEVYRKPIRIKVLVTSEGNISQLKHAIYEQTGVEAGNLRVFEVFKSRVHKFFNDRDALSEITINDIIFVCEVLSEKLAGEEVYECVVFQRKSFPSSPMKCSYCHTESRETLKRCTRCLKAAYCNQECQKKHWTTHKDLCKMIMEPVGMPFMISLPASHATYARISQTMESIARYSTDMFQPPVSNPTTPHSSPPTTSPVKGMDSSFSPPPEKSPEDVAIDDDDSSMVDVDAELAAEMIIKDSPVQSSDDEGAAKGAVGGQKRGSREDTKDGVATASVLGHQQVQAERRQPLFFIKPCNNQGKGLRGTIGERLKDNGDTPLDLSEYTALALDWRNDPKQVNHVMVETKSLDFEEDITDGGSSHERRTTLQQCLRLFTEKEKLAPDEAWFCPRCKEHREASKELSLWRLPSILIVQLKRFSFKNFIWRDKIDKMVEFPLRGLDMSEYSQVKGGSPVYDLYGVINHHGGILGGHYTAYSKLISQENINQNELEWRLFDDSHVTRVSEDNVMTRSAYLLFYRQRRPYVPYVSRSLRPVRSSDEPGSSVSDRSATSRPAAASASGDSQPAGQPSDVPMDEREDEDSSEEEPDIREDELSATKGETLEYTNIDEID